MGMSDYRKELCETSGGRERLLGLENIVRDIWNNPRLSRQDLVYIAFLLKAQTEERDLTGGGA